VSITTIVRQLRSSSLVRHNLIFFIGSLATGALNYLYYPVLGRFMPPSAFGEVQVLVSLFLQLTIFLTVLSMITVNIVANYRDEDTRNKVIYEIEKLTFIIGVVLLLIVALISPALKTFFQFDSALPFTALALAFVAGIPLTSRTAYLRGKQAFAKTAVANCIAAGGKIFGSLALVVVGFGTLGAIFGIVGAQLFAAAWAAHTARRLGLTKTVGAWKKLPRLRVIRPELKYAGLVLVTSLVITLHYSIDIIAIKHYFDAHTAGVYAGIATVGRILFFLTASITQVMLPAVRLAHPPAQNRRVLVHSLALLLLVSVPVMLLFFLLPHETVEMLMGKNYNTMASLLPDLSLAMVIIAGLNLFINYYVALRRYDMLVFAIIDAVVVSMWVLVHHQTPAAVVESLLASSATMTGLLGVWAILYKLKKLKKPYTNEEATHNGHRTGL